MKVSSLKAGDIAEGDLKRDVYSGDKKIFPAGSHVRLTVDHLERRHRTGREDWPWVAKLFLPRHETFPLFREADISSPETPASRLQVSLITSVPMRDVQNNSKKKRGKEKDGATVSPAPQQRASRSATPVLALEAHDQADVPFSDTPALAVAFQKSVTLPAGTNFRVLLLNHVSASKSHPGDAVEARLLEPVDLESQFHVPAGSIFTGTVLKATPPKMLSRAGSLSLTFTGLTLPGGNRIPVSASLTALELNRSSHIKMDAEGKLHGDRPGVRWMLINGGVTAGIAKEVDDGTQLILEAILSGATDASTAGTARIAGTVVSGIFMLTRHGRDVVIPAYSEMSLTLSRPLTLSGTPTSPN